MQFSILAKASQLLLLTAAYLVIKDLRPEGSMLRVYYVPIGWETLTPVTPENIEKRRAVCVVSTPKVVSEIKRVIDSATTMSRAGGAFDDKRVRVKVIEETERGERLLILVDNDGVVRRDGVDRTLSSKSLRKLKGLIEAACGV